MPKVYLTERERFNAELAKWVYGEMKERKLSQQKVADKMFISRQALGRKLKEKSFDYCDFVFFVKEFQPGEKTLNNLLGL